MVWLVGCAAEQHEPPAGLVQSPAFDIPAKQMAVDVRQIVSAPPISLPVTEVEAGTILTGWQPFRGELHLVRYWHERTRYRITVVPDFNQPDKRSRIQVVDESEQRPAESGPNIKATEWSAAPELHRPERAAAILRQIENQLSSYH